MTYTPTSPDTNNTAPATPAAPALPPSDTTQTPAGTEAHLENAVDQSPQLAAANAAVQSAQSEYDSARQRVVATLTITPEYQQAMARRHEASGELAAVKASPSSMPSVVDAASAKLEAADEVTKMEEQAIATDPAAAAAKTHLNEAVSARDGLRAHMLAGH